jgi:hypothetical protein
MTDEKNGAIATLDSMITTTRPAGADEGTLGNEGIGREDITMPRIGLAQKMSPEIDPTNQQRYIDGLQFTDFFNSGSRQKLGKGPLNFVILRRETPRWVEFNPIDEGGGIKDMHVPAGDPRTKYTTDENGRSIKPLATMFCDYIIMLVNETTLTDPIANVVALSLKGSGIKASKDLNLLITQRGKKMICKGVYSMQSGSATDKNSGGVYAIYQFKNKGWLKEGSPLETLAIEMFDAWKEREVKIDADADAFEPAAYDGAAKDM